MLIDKSSAILWGIRMVSESGKIIFTTGNIIESNYWRNS